MADRPFIPWLGWSMLVLVVLAQALRWWCIRTLGVRWNTRVIVVPGLPLVTGGPYRWLRHPNYVAVVVEGIALPLVHTAWVTAVRVHRAQHPAAGRAAALRGGGARTAPAAAPAPEAR